MKMLLQTVKYIANIFLQKYISILYFSSLLKHVLYEMFNWLIIYISSTYIVPKLSQVTRFF